jgi:hypothetical protein
MIGCSGPFSAANLFIIKLDGILNEMIKYGQHALLPCLEKLFNIILSSGTYSKIYIFPDFCMYLQINVFNLKI